MKHEVKLWQCLPQNFMGTKGAYELKKHKYRNSIEHY